MPETLSQVYLWYMFCGAEDEFPHVWTIKISNLNQTPILTLTI